MMPGDEVIFFGKRYTLLEPAGRFGWVAIERDNISAQPRIILSEYLRPAEPLKKP